MKKIYTILISIAFCVSYFSSVAVAKRYDYYCSCDIVDDGSDNPSCTCNDSGTFSVAPLASPSFYFTCNGEGAHGLIKVLNFSGNSPSSAMHCGAFMSTWNNNRTTVFRVCTNWSAIHRHEIKWDGIECYKGVTQGNE